MNLAILKLAILKEFPETLKNFSSLFFRYLYKNETEGSSCGEKWLFKGVLYTAGIFAA